MEGEESDTLGVTVNAATGALISLYTYQPGMLTKDRPAFTAADFQATADAFAQKYFPDQWTNLKCTQVAEDVSMYSYARTADFTYTRQYNGYSFYENSLTVSVDVDTGKIVFAGLIWNDGQEFEEPGHAAYRRGGAGCVSEGADPGKRLCFRGEGSAAERFRL